MIFKTQMKENGAHDDDGPSTRGVAYMFPHKNHTNMK